MANASTTEYNIDNVYRAFTDLINKSNRESIRLPEFVIAFRELAKFFNHLNIVFSFVADDLIDKFDLIDSCTRNNPRLYQTVQSMIDFERDRDDRSGTVSLLRLLRALEFTYLFLERSIISPADSKSTKEIAWEVYKETLYKRHNKAIRASVWIATATIPNREKLRKILTRGEVEPNTSDKVFPMIERVYNQIYKIYEENDLLELAPL